MQIHLPIHTSRHLVPTQKLAAAVVTIKTTKASCGSTSAMQKLYIKISTLQECLSPTCIDEHWPKKGPSPKTPAGSPDLQDSS